MNNQISNKISFWIVCIIGIASLYFIYGNTYGHIWKMKADYEQLMELSESGRDYSQEVLLLNKRLKTVNSLIGEEEITGGEIQQQLLLLLEQNSDSLDIEVINVPTPHSFKNEGFTIITQSFEISGGYHSLVRTISFLEKHFKYASISSSSILVTREGELRMNIYLQNIFQ